MAAPSKVQVVTHIGNSRHKFMARRCLQRCVGVSHTKFVITHGNKSISFAINIPNYANFALRVKMWHPVSRR
jgi:hypothetical protein